MNHAQLVMNTSPTT